MVREQMDVWLPDPELAVYAGEYARTGFQGMLNWYRVITDPGCMRDVEVFAGRNIEVPLLYMSGGRDWGSFQEPGVLGGMERVCTRLRGVELLEGAGHWVQQERPEEVVRLVVGFLRGVKKEGISY